MKLSKAQRAELFSMFGGKCAYCGHELTKTWQADHIEAVDRITKWVQDPKAKTPYHKWKTICVGLGKPHLDVIGNMVPACRPCNIHKSNFSLEEWRKYLNRQVDMARRNSAPFRHAERFGLVLDTSHPVVFWFEKLQVVQKTDTEDL